MKSTNVKRKMNKKTSIAEKGITLVALVVTIIILLILAGVTLNLVLSNNGLIGRAKQGITKYQEASHNEQADLDYMGDLIDEISDLQRTKYTVWNTSSGIAVLNKNTNILYILNQYISSAVEFKEENADRTIENVVDITVDGYLMNDNKFYDYSGNELFDNLLEIQEYGFYSQDFYYLTSDGKVYNFEWESDILDYEKKLNVKI